MSGLKQYLGDTLGDSIQNAMDEIDRLRESNRELREMLEFVQAQLDMDEPDQWLKMRQQIRLVLAKVKL
jgi:hypothetical protein